jgi:LPXTG-motif cell wall-anchored protein
MELFVMKLQLKIFNICKSLRELLKYRYALTTGLLSVTAIIGLVALNQENVLALNSYGYPEKSTYGYPEYQSYGYPARDSSIKSGNTNQGSCNRECNLHPSTHMRSCNKKADRNVKCRYAQQSQTENCTGNCKAVIGLNNVPNIKLRTGIDSTHHQRDFKNRSKPPQDSSLVGASVPDIKSIVNIFQSDSYRPEVLQENIDATERTDTLNASPTSYNQASAMKELPKTGTQEPFFASMGVGSLVAVFYAYIRSRRAIADTPSIFRQ